MFLIGSLIECAGPATAATADALVAVHIESAKEIENKMQPFVIVWSMPDFSLWLGERGEGHPSETGFLRINKLPTSVDTFPNFWVSTIV